MDMSHALFQGLQEAIKKVKLLVIPYFKKQISWEIHNDDISQRHTALEKSYYILRRMEII